MTWQCQEDLRRTSSLQIWVANIFICQNGGIFFLPWELEEVRRNENDFKNNFKNDAFFL